MIGRNEFHEYMKRKHGVSDLYQYLRSASYDSDWADWQAAYSAGAEHERERIKNDPAARLFGRTLSQIEAALSLYEERNVSGCGI